MKRRANRLSCFLIVALLPLSGVAQESVESRAARLQPEDIPPLVQKAQNGDVISEALLWLAYSHGYGVTKDFNKGLPWLRKAAEQDLAEAQFILSNVYQFGYGETQVDYSEAFKWAMKAAQHGHMVAQHNVGSMYRHGEGVEQNFQQARIWYQRAAERGFAHSQWSLGVMNYRGIGAPPNREEALKWLSLSLAQEHYPSMSTLANMFTDANGHPEQPQLVFDLRRAAAQLGDHYSEFQLGRFYRAGYLGAPDYPEALAWFERAANAGYAPADAQIAEMYEAGQGVVADTSQARNHYERAASFGVSGAIQKMGELYRDGRGVPTDLVTASTWFIIGSEMGIQSSKDSLQALSLTDAQRQMAAARANTWTVEHPGAAQQKPDHFYYPEWVMIDLDRPPHREPSTENERAYAILLTKRLENDPLSLDAYAARGWLDTWWWEIPDVTLRPCNLVDAPNHEPYQFETELFKQVTYSQGTYLLQNPGKEVDWNAAFLAGLNGALRAYEAILKQRPSSARATFLDDLLHQRDTGVLETTVRDLAKQRCK